jgi:hypothetical protein
MSVKTIKKRSVVDRTERVIKNCLMDWFNACPELHDQGLEWYKEAYEFTHRIAKKYGIDAYTVAVVLSFLSPNNKWERNKIDCEEVIIAYLLGKSPDDVKVCTYTANKIKAFKAMEGLDIEESAPKTYAFAMNIAYMSPDHVTIDKWHLRACLTKPREGVVDCVESCTKAQYKRIEKLTAKLAKKLGITGYELQAIIWVSIKHKWNR